MQNGTYEEFKDVIKNGWELQFKVGDVEFYYERLSMGQTSTAHLSHIDDKKPFFNQQFNDNDELLEAILSQKIVGEKTIPDLVDEIEITRQVR